MCICTDIISETKCPQIRKKCTTQKYDVHFRVILNLSEHWLFFEFFIQISLLSIIALIKTIH